MPWAPALDAVLVLVFAALGRASHAEENAVLGALGTAWPFLVGLGLGWALVRWRSRHWPLTVGNGIAVWLCTLVGGMLLRAATGQGTAPSFVAVAGAVDEVQHGIAPAALRVAGRQVDMRPALDPQGFRPVLEHRNQSVRHAAVVRLERAGRAGHLERGARAIAFGGERGGHRVGHHRAIHEEGVAVVVRIDRPAGCRAPHTHAVAGHGQARRAGAEGHDARQVRAGHVHRGGIGRAEPERDAAVCQGLDRFHRGCTPRRAVLGCGTCRGRLGHGELREAQAERAAGDPQGKSAIVHVITPVWPPC